MTRPGSPAFETEWKKIRELLDRVHWRLRPGEINIADIPSRGCSAEDFRSHHWWIDPEFLNHSPECWPREPHQSCIDNEEKALVELKKTSTCIVYSMSNPSTNCDRQTSGIGNIIDMNRYSTKLKLLRVKAAVRRCAEKWKNPHHKFESTELTAQELQEAERILIRNIQEHELQCESQCLAGASTILTPIVSRLGVVLDKDALIRCEGRIQKSSQEQETKRPIILPAKHYFTKLQAWTKIVGTLKGKSHIL